MKILFIKDLAGVAHKDEIKELNDGYAKNFIIARGFGVLATAKEISKLQNEQKQEEQRKQRQIGKLTNLKSELEKRTFVFEVKAGDKNQIFGSISEKDVIKKIKDKLNMELDKKQIIMPKIREVGEYPIEIKLLSGVIAQTKIKITPIQ